MQKIPERKIRFQTPDNYNSLSENENETWRAPHHGENESVLGSECLTNLNADGLGKRSKKCRHEKMRKPTSWACGRFLILQKIFG